MTHSQPVQKFTFMKQIDEIGPFNPNKLFQTPQKKQKTLKKSPDLKGISPCYLETKQKFDLGESPRFKASTDIRIDQQPSSAKQQLLESVKKQYSSPMIIKVEESPYSSIQRLISLRRKQQALREKYGNLRIKENLNKCYAKLIKQIQEGHLVEIPQPQIIDQPNISENLYSQLLNFTLNFKNSRKLVYDNKKQTIIPVYECLGCKKEFDNSPALGGHLRSCYQKKAHYHQLQKYFRSCQKSEISSQSHEPQSSNSEELLDQDFLKKEIFKTPEKSIKIEDEKMNRITSKQKENNSVFFSSEEKSISKSVQGSQKPFDNKDQIFKNESKEQGYQEGSAEFDLMEQKTVRKYKGIDKRRKTNRDLKGKMTISKNQ